MTGESHWTVLSSSLFRRGVLVSFIALNTLSEGALPNGRQSNNEIHILRLGNFSSPVGSFTSITFFQYDSADNSNNADWLETSNNSKGKLECDLHSLSASSTSHESYKIGNLSNSLYRVGTLRIDRELKRQLSCEALPKMDNYNQFTVEIGLGRHSPDQLHLAIWLNWFLRVGYYTDFS